MIGPCPFPCFNKNRIGYCQTTGCTNPKFSGLEFLDERTRYDIAAERDMYSLCAYKVSEDGTVIRQPITKEEYDKIMFEKDPDYGRGNYA